MEAISDCQSLKVVLVRAFAARRVSRRYFYHRRFALCICPGETDKGGLDVRPVLGLTIGIALIGRFADGW